MYKIAIIEFPGLNTEMETRREINKAQMKGEFFRWNEDPKKLAKYDGFIIGGGFSYEDRGRAGIIAALDPLMSALKLEAEKGKPVLGICNGAQILVESGLVPGADGEKIAMALARNKRIRNGQVLGTGYYNVWTNAKCTVPKGSNMFTNCFEEGEIVSAPIAHGEGRFTSDFADLMPELLEKGQIVFRYCDKQGVMSSEFPVNPNGAMFNSAAICNPAGNVMAIMPHFERAKIAGEKLFNSMRMALEAQKAGNAKTRSHHIKVPSLNLWPLAKLESPLKSMQMCVELIITDNEADTHEMTLRHLGFENVKLRRKTHFEIEFEKKPDLQKLMKKLIQSGVLVNTNKELAAVKFPKETLAFDAKREKFVPEICHPEPVEGSKAGQNPLIHTTKILVREKPDFIGQSKLSVIQNRLKMPEIIGVKMGTLWRIDIETKSSKVAEETMKKIINTHLFWNPHRQDAHVIPA